MYNSPEKMVRINLIKPKYLADQHLIAEYNEILMLLGYVKKYPGCTRIPHNYVLGPGHITFFKNKLLYLKKRHDIIKKEMRRRNFVPRKTIDLSLFPKKLINNWKPNEIDKKIIRFRIVTKLKAKPNYYRYAGLHYPISFFLELIKKSN
jgi:deoxyribonuclease (pyrimidine dimer)